MSGIQTDGCTHAPSTDIVFSTVNLAIGFVRYYWLMRPSNDLFLEYGHRFLAVDTAAINRAMNVLISKKN